MILVVDDDQAIRLSIGLMLSKAGYVSEQVGNEADALEAVRSPELQLVILDLNLTLSTTGRQGIELLRKIRILAPEVPVILLSAWATVPLAVEGMGFGAVDMISKPWSNTEFLAKIKKALAEASRRAEENKVDTLENTEKQTILKAIRQADGNLTVAAQLLGITRQSLYRRMEKFGIKY